MNSDTETSDIELNTEDVDDYNDDMCDIEKIMIKPEKTVIETVSDDKRTGRQLMTSKEFIRIVSERKVELIMGAKPLIKQNPKSEKLTYEEIAIEEIKLNTLKKDIIEKVITPIIPNKFLDNKTKLFINRDRSSIS